MDAERFDALTRVLTGAAFARRRLLAGTAGSTLAALVGVFGATEVGATHLGCNHAGEPCRKGRGCCSGRCNKHHKCRAHDKGICKAGQDACDQTSLETCGANGASACFCYVTTGRASFCGTATTGSSCTHDTDCVTDKGAGAACVSCAAIGQNVCVARCPAPD